MSFTIKVVGLPELRARLKDFSDRRFNATLATALTRTAVEVRAALVAEMPRVFDRPTPYTLRQMRYVGATADKLVAAVGFNIAAIQDAHGNVLRYQDLGAGETPAGKYLQYSIDGGQRRDKRLEAALRASGALPDGYYVVPGAGATLDAYGNVSRGQVIQVLSQLRVQLVAGSSRNMSTGARKQINAQRKAGGRFFVMPVGSRVRAGIYQRELMGRNITPVFIFVRRATYRRRWAFDAFAERVGSAAMVANVERAVKEQIARLEAKTAGA